MNEKFQVAFDSLCQLPHRMHLYLTDTEHRILHLNDLQLSIVEKLCGAISLKDLQGLSVTDVYCQNYPHAMRICQQNETILQSGQPHQSIDHVVIPNHVALTLQTTKLPYYDSDGKMRGVFGISYYEREINLAKAKEYNLTVRELDCIDWTLMDKTAKEIANILNISARTIEDYLNNIRHKLNCQTKLELIKKVKSMDIIKRYLLPISPKR